MRRIVPVVPVVLAAVLAGGCASSNERVVYVPATTSGAMMAGDTLGMQMMRSGGAVTVASNSERAASNPEPMAFTTFAPSPDASIVAAAQGGFVTMMSSYPNYGRMRDSEVRMPVATFAATDGPSPD